MWATFGMLTFMFLICKSPVWWVYLDVHGQARRHNEFIYICMSYVDLPVPQGEQVVYGETSQFLYFCRFFSPSVRRLTNRCQHRKSHIRKCALYMLITVFPRAMLWSTTHEYYTHLLVILYIHVIKVHGVHIKCHHYPSKNTHAHWFYVIRVKDFQQPVKSRWYIAACYSGFLHA